MHRSACLTSATVGARKKASCCLRMRRSAMGHARAQPPVCRAAASRAATASCNSAATSRNSRTEMKVLPEPVSRKAMI